MHFIKKIISYLDKTCLNDLLKRVILYSTPVTSLTIDISGRCNLKCRMCSLDEYSKVENKVLPLDFVKKIANELKNITHISLQCNCEPLLNPDIGQIIKILKQQKPNLKVSMVTNGTLLNSNRSEEIISSGIDEVYVSIDGATKPTYERIRIGSNFEKVLANISEFNRIRFLSVDKKPQLGIITVLSRENGNELIDICNLAINLKATTYVVNNLEPYNEKMNKLVMYSKKTNTELQKMILNLISTANKQNLKLRLPAMRIKTSNHCFLTGITIDSDGNVFPCPQLSYERPYYRGDQSFTHPMVTLGNLKDTRLSEILNSYAYKTIKRKLLFGRLPEYCQSCLVKDKVICG